MQKLDKPPLKATVELKGLEIHFEAMESETADQLPTPDDWWLERIIDTKTGIPLNPRQKCDFELDNEDNIHQLIYDKCKEIKEAGDEDYATRNW